MEKAMAPTQLCEEEARLRHDREEEAEEVQVRRRSAAAAAVENCRCSSRATGRELCCIRQIQQQRTDRLWQPPPCSSWVTCSAVEPHPVGHPCLGQVLQSRTILAETRTTAVAFYPHTL